MIGFSCTSLSPLPVREVLDMAVGRFELWEIFAEQEHSLVDNRAVFSDLLPSYDLSYSVHTPISDINIASINERVRIASLNEVESCARIGSELGITVVTVHPGLEPLAVKGRTEAAIAQAKRSIRHLDSVAEEYGLEMGIENMPLMPYFLGRTAETLADLVDGTDLGVTFDIGHAFTMGEVDAMIDTFKDRMVNIHIHDNDGDKDAHMTIGDGSIDFEDVLSKLSGYGGNYVIESKTFQSAVDSSVVLQGLL